MRIIDIKRQKKWLLCEVQVDSISEPVEAMHGDLVQSMEITLAQGVKDVMNYYFKDLSFQVGLEEVGRQWYDIVWTGEYLKCKPATAPEDDKFKSSIDWNAINLGKCRHGILCAYVKNKGFEKLFVDTGFKPFEHINPFIADGINELAKFSMTGEISDVEPTPNS